MANLKSVPVPDTNYVIKELGDDIILISRKENIIHTLDMVGALIWKNIDGKKNLGQILDIICSEFEVEKKYAENDLFTFVAKLADTGLIKI